MKKTSLSALRPRDFELLPLDGKRILRYFQTENAFWQYEGEPSPDKPHAQLTSDMCSNGYFDVPRILRYPNVAEILGRHLAQKLRAVGIGDVDWVVSSAYSAIVFGHEVAKALGAIFLNVEKDPSDPRGKRMLWRRQTIPVGSRVLQIEETIVTFKTLLEVQRAVTEGNSERFDFISVAGACVLRPDKLLEEYDGQRIIALLEKEVQNFPKEECPYCRVGSRRYEPRFHWEELTGKV